MGIRHEIVKNRGRADARKINLHYFLQDINIRCSIVEI